MGEQMAAKALLDKKQPEKKHSEKKPPDPKQLEKQQMDRKRYTFSIGLLMVILVLCMFIYPIATSLTIYSGYQKQELLNSLELPLEKLAVEQARILDPNYAWIEYSEDYSEEIKSAIRDTVLTNQSQNPNAIPGESLAADSNLAWIITYNGKEIRHNWQNEYDTEKGILDLTFSSGVNGISMHQSVVQGYRQPFGMFNIQNRTVIHPGLLDQENIIAGSMDFFYTITLPQGFSIRYYIPSQLKANGGLIARQAGSEDSSRYRMLIIAGTAVLALYILLWNKDIEARAPVFSRFTKMKAFTCWMFLLISLTLMGFLVPWISESTATGVLKEQLISMGMPPGQVRWILTSLCFTAWYLFFYLCALAMTYVKYIFGFGFGRYLREDTFVASLVNKADHQLAKSARVTLNEWTWTRLLPWVLLLCALIMAVLIAGSFFFGFIGAAIALLIVAFLLVMAARRVYSILHHDYSTTLSAANELAQGNFSDIHPRQVGAFQNLYNELIDIKDGFQNALKEGLANQNMKTQLISNVSHDLKTPVTGIKSYAELISMATSLEDVHNYSKRLENYTDRLNTLIEDLFDVARANSGDIKLEPILLNLSELILQVESEWEETMAKKQITMIADLPQKAMTTLDPAKTMRVIDNLMSNIHKYTMEGTRVFITLQELPNEYVVVLKNISKAPLDFSPEQITERFVRGDKSRHEPGSGLGLAIVKSFMEVQKGNCTIDIDGDVFKAILTFPKIVPAETARIVNSVEE